MQHYSFYLFDNTETLGELLRSYNETGLIDYDELESFEIKLDLFLNDDSSVIKSSIDIEEYAESISDELYDPYGAFLYSTFFTGLGMADHYYINSDFECTVNNTGFVIRTILPFSKKVELIEHFEQINWKGIEEVYSSTYGINYLEFKSDIENWAELIKKIPEEGCLMIMMS